jgi:glyoxylase-like metal-dependent hydrolase (beta-lactamase superfamily II)
MQAGAEHKVPFEEGAGAFEDGEDFLLLLIHAADGGSTREKNKNFFATRRAVLQGPCVVIEYAPLEDELGDVLEKAMQHCGISEQALAERASVPLEKIRDAIDYRYDFSPEDLRQLATALALNEVGLLALAQRTYPLPEISGLPFCVHPLRMPHGIGVANAYIVAECGGDHGLLFDTGPDYLQLRRFWPKAIQSVDAVFVTHAETEHTGGLETLRSQQPRVPVFAPGSAGKILPGLTVPEEGACLSFGDFEVRVLRTPGHAEAHNCYLVRVPKLPQASSLLISGDLIFAGSVGGAFYCQRRLVENFRRLLAQLPENTVIAPGHGPLTTIKNERRFNPFAL